MKIKLQKIQESVPALNFFMQQELNAALSFLIIELVEEVNDHLKKIKKATEGKEMTPEIIEELMSTEVEIHTSLPKSLLTFDIKPIHLSGIRPFLID